MSKQSYPARANESPSGPETETVIAANHLREAGDLLRAGMPEAALGVLRRSRDDSPWAVNARGVCHLRMGDSEAALDVFRSLALAPGGLIMRRDATAAVKMNYAAALLLSDNLSGCLDVLAETRGESHPAAARLRGAIRGWKEGLSFWQKINWWMGGQPHKPVALDFEPGDLE